MDNCLKIKQPKKKKRENKRKDKKMFFGKCEEMFSIKMLYENNCCLLLSDFLSPTGNI